MSLLEKISQEKIPRQLLTLATYDVTTDMYKIESYYPAQVLEPLLESSSHISITLQAKDVRDRKDDFVRRLLAD